MKNNNIFVVRDPQQENSYCEINMLGGGIMNLYLNGKHILYAGTRPDGGQAFTHPCIPNFNIADDLPNHGPARKELWTLVNDNTITWEMSEIDDIYPSGIKATRQFEISKKSFTVSTTIKNISKTSLPTNIAEHSYFACPKDQVKNIKINGKPFHKEALQANAQFNPWQNKNILEIPFLGEIKFNTTGYNAFAQWSQPEAPFACIEPIEIMPPRPENFMSSAPLLSPNKEKLFIYSIVIT